MKKEKEFLRQQLELLAERSKGAMVKDLCDITIAMNATYKSLLRPSWAAAFAIGLLIAALYLVVGRLV